MVIETNAGRTPPPNLRRGDIPADTFAARLRLARMHASDISIRDAAPMCGLNYGTWTHWEKGGAPRNILDVVEKISEALGVDREWLLFGGPLAQAEDNRRRWISGAGRVTDA